jgi:hypothetical protein
MIAITTIAGVPTDPDALTSFPGLRAFPHNVDYADYFVSRHTRILNSGPLSFFD